MASMALALAIAKVRTQLFGEALEGTAQLFSWAGVLLTWIGDIVRC